MNATRFTNGFSEKIIFRGKRAILCLKMGHPHNFGFALRIFLKILLNGRGSEIYGNHINVFLKKKFI